MWSRALTTVGMAGLLLPGCATTPSPTTGAQPVRVVAGAYPFAFLAETIGGERVSVETLARPGAEPHDLELTARQVIHLAKADLVITLPGFQPAVDQGIVAAAPRAVLDLSGATGVTFGSHAEHSPSEGHADENSHEEGAADPAHDPHFWLDPSSMAAASDAVAAALTTADPEGAATYAANRDRLDARLSELRTEYRAGLAHCASRDLVTSHAAYAHLASFTGLEPHPLALDPEAEPSAATLATIATLVRDHGVRTIYTEPLSSPKAAQVIARETGVRTASLDPIEGLLDPATDYLTIMSANLVALRQGQECS